ncbi:MAG: hypothetical protein E7586_00745 [Ruminococcaceae bacterium]|nr:hypothetical protein [Oscillospiraceae bacterium]
MDLKKIFEKFVDKKVIITDIDEKRFMGIIDDYIDAEDNYSNKEGIILNTKSGLYEFTKDDIKKIELI